MAEPQRILYIDCFAGAAGDMLLGALLHVGASEVRVREELARMDLHNWTLDVEPDAIQGIGGINVSVRVGGIKEGESGDHSHSHGGADSAHGHSFQSIRALLERSSLTPAVRDRSLAVFTRLAEAEGEVHGVPADEVHFHEVGAVDAIVDIVGCSAALEDLGVDRVISAPPPMARGFVQCAHGAMPLPAPATVLLLHGVPTVGASIEGELVTPTGAALLTTFADAFGGWPEMTVTCVGYGLGDKRWPDRPNLLRLVLGEQSAASSGTEVVIETNIDDMPAEWFPPLMDRLLDEGADDVWMSSIQMKKGRPGTRLSVLAPAEARARLVGTILGESSAIGVRFHAVERTKLVRRIDSIQTAHGPISVKTAWDGDVRVHAAPEFEACQQMAKKMGLPLKAIYREVERALAEDPWKESQ
jgi:hypothetical protein